MPTGTMRSLFAESSSSSGSGRDREAEPVAAVLCAPRPRRVQVHPCSADLILGPPPFLLNSSGNGRKQREGKSKTGEDEDDQEGWGMFGGSPPARADNPLVHDPHFLLNQRHHHNNAASSDINIAVFDSHRNHHHVPTYSNSNSNSSSFAPSYAPAVRIQGFDVASCRSSHGGNAGGRVLSARA
uniref:Uncharacterized protein n=1 Tax=Avena sativa TaxID=4498 RepID=A0ACD5WJJ3_AVESA